MVVLDLLAHATGVLVEPGANYLTYLLMVLMLLALAGICWIALTWYRSADARGASYEALVQQMGEGIGVVDLDERFVYANPAAERIFGVEAGGLIGRRIQEFVSQDALHDVLRQTAMRLQSITSSYELTITNARGVRRHISVTASPELDKHGEICGTYGLIQDVTDRRDAEDALRQLNLDLEHRIAQRTADLSRSEERYRTLVETMPDGMAVQNSELRLTYVNPSFCEMLGYREDELLGHLTTEFMDQDNRQLLLEQTERRRRGERGQYELTWTHRQGREVTALVSPAPILDARGRFQGSFAVFNDVTEDKRNAMLQRKHWQLLDGIATATYLLVSAEDRDEAIAQTLAVLGHAAGADRVQLFANDWDRLSGEPCFRPNQEWTREGVSPAGWPAGETSYCYAEMLPGWYEELSLGRPVIRQASSFSSLEHARFGSGKVRSVLAVPVSLGAETWGFIRIDDCQAEREWSESEIATLLAVASSIGGFIVKSRVEEQRERLIAELQDALTQIKVLRGLIPICSYCKKIRDDQGYWNQIEAYVAEHSEAEFSHSICPECVEVHFPKLGLGQSKSVTSDLRPD